MTPSEVTKAVAVSRMIFLQCQGRRLDKADLTLATNGPGSNRQVPQG
jgi:hypothetical protein